MKEIRITQGSLRGKIRKMNTWKIRGDQQTDKNRNITVGDKKVNIYYENVEKGWDNSITT